MEIARVPFDADEMPIHEGTGRMRRKNAPAGSAAASVENALLHRFFNKHDEESKEIATAQQLDHEDTPRNTGAA